jgi:two-component system OmpR family sensor kinase
MSRALAPLAAGLLGLAGSLGTTLFLHHAASGALDRVLEERLRGAGETAARLLGRTAATVPELRAIMEANGLEGAYVLSPSLEVVADATGSAGVKADLLRVDGSRVARALAGEVTVAFAYAVGDLRVATGYFPVRDREGSVRGALALEAGQSFAAAREKLRRALWTGIGLSLLGALALGAVALRWSRAEEARRRAAAGSARGDALARMAAMVAHEIRNPIGVIRSAVELVRERAGSKLSSSDQEALEDVLGEVERLRRLTQDFLDLAREPTLALACIDVAMVAVDAVRSAERSYPDVAFQVALPQMRTSADAGRLRQVFVNLLVNAAQAGAQTVEISGDASAGMARIKIRDDGPGIDRAVRERLFEPFATSRVKGTGLGLAISRRIVDRHGGRLTLVSDGAAGTAFELRLPLSAG